MRARFFSVKILYYCFCKTYVSTKILPPYQILVCQKVCLVRQVSSDGGTFYFYFFLQVTLSCWRFLTFQCCYKGICMHYMFIDVKWLRALYFDLGAVLTVIVNTYPLCSFTSLTSPLRMKGCLMVCTFISNKYFIFPVKPLILFLLHTVWHLFYEVSGLSPKSCRNISLGNWFLLP